MARSHYASQMCGGENNRFGVGSQLALEMKPPLRNAKDASYLYDVLDLYRALIQSYGALADKKRLTQEAVRFRENRRALEEP